MFVYFVFVFSFSLSAAVIRYLRLHAPTNRAVSWLRSPRSLKWAIPVALVATPAYLFAMATCAELAHRPGFGWLSVLVFLFLWNAVKFACLAVFALHLMLRDALARKATKAHQLSVHPGFEYVRPIRPGQVAWTRGRAPHVADVRGRASEVPELRLPRPTRMTTQSPPCVGAPLPWTGGNR